MAAQPLSEEIVERILLAVDAAAKANPGAPFKSSNSRTPSVNAMAMNALITEGGTRPTWQTRFRVAEFRRPEDWERAMRGEYTPRQPGEAAPEPPPEAKPRTLQDDVDLHRARADSASYKARLKESLAEIDRLQTRLRELEWAASASYTPAEWTHSAPSGKSERMPCLLTSDFQIGEVIRPEEIDCAHGYSTPIFQRRYRQLIETAINLCLHHQAGWTFPGIIYERLGDTISGGIHEELAETDDLTPIEAVEIAAEEEMAGIAKLADAFGKVEVKDAGGGNHDRTTHKPRSKGANAHSLDRLVSYILRREFRTDPRVTFQVTESPDIYFPVYDRRILGTHGDKIGSRGGMGMIGPAATIARGAQKVIMEQQALGRRVDEVHMGHFHNALDLDYAVCNGCLPGYSEYAKMNRLRPAPPSQFLMFYHPVYGRVATKKIVLEKPIISEVAWAA